MEGATGMFMARNGGGVCKKESEMCAMRGTMCFGMSGMMCGRSSLLL